MLRFSLPSAVGAVGIAATIHTAAAQFPEDSLRASIPIDVSLSPFVTFLPKGTALPMTGLALAVAGGPFALRASGHLSLQERSALSTSTVTMRPWGADADAVAYLESLSYGNLFAFTPYVFTGVSIAAVDSGVQRLIRKGWSYGGGLGLPLGSVLGVFGEWRWRMSRFVLPESRTAPAPTSEVRVGLAFHVGRGGGNPGGAIPVFSSPDDEFVSLAGAPTSNSSATRLLSTAGRYVGTPYRRGGTSPGGFDASGFVRFVFSQFGVILPRTSRDQARVGERIRTDWRAIAPGDLLMFRDDGGINHVAIYVGQGRIIHSSETGGGVRYDDLNTERGRWFADHLVAARRVTPDLRGLLLDLARGYATDVSDNVDGPDHAPRERSMRRRN